MNSIFQVLTLSWSLMGGQYFQNAINDDGVFTTNNNSFIQMAFELQFPLSWKKGDQNNFFISDDVENQFSKVGSKDWTFSPQQDAFKITTGVRFSGVELGFQHECIHPIVFSQNSEPLKYFASYDKVYAKITGSF